MIRSPQELKKHDLGSVRFIYTGAAPMGEETIQDLKKLYPKWHVGQAYGMSRSVTR